MKVGKEVPELEPLAAAWGEDTTEDHWSTKPLEMEPLVCGAGGTTGHSHLVTGSLTEKPKSNHYPTKKAKILPSNLLQGEHDAFLPSPQATEG